MSETLSALRTELRAHLGFAAVASGSGPQDTLLDSFLTRAQEWLYWQYTWEHLRRAWTLSLTVGTGAYAWPANAASETIEPRRLLSASLSDGTLLREDVTPVNRTDTSQGKPGYYFRTDQFNVYPVPDQAYTAVLDGYRALSAFSADSDTTTVDPQMVLLLAIINAKTHYKQDAKVYEQQLTGLLQALGADNINDAAVAAQ